MTEKTYVNGLFIKNKTFQNGGNVVNISINVDKFIEELKVLKNEKGYCNIVLQHRKETDKNGNNMYAILNTYTPKDNNNNASIEDAEVLPITLCI